MKVYFSHGMESGPWGSKIQHLAESAGDSGFAVDSIDYTDTMDPDVRAERLIEIISQESDDCLLVGSSMGGYVSLVVSQSVDVSGVFLIAPALYIPGYRHQQYESRCSHIEVIHGWSDEVIPVDHSIRYARDADCTLHLISGDHRLNSSIDVVDMNFRSFLSNWTI